MGRCWYTVLHFFFHVHEYKCIIIISNCIYRHLNTEMERLAKENNGIDTLPIFKNDVQILNILLLFLELIFKN
jgi:hypothetical protein